MIVVVGERRVEAARRAADLGADLFLLDDGFQHLAVGRDVNLLLFDARDPFGGGSLPPRGPPARAARGDAPRRRHRVHAGRTGRAARPTSSPRSPGSTRRRPSSTPGSAAPGLRDEQGSPVEPGSLSGAALVAVCGVADAVAVRGRRSRELGIVPEETIDFRDHQRYRERHLTRIRRAPRSAPARAWVVTTEKDAVKLAGKTSLPLVTVRLGVEVVEPAFFPFLGLAPGSRAGRRGAEVVTARSAARDRAEHALFRLATGAVSALPGRAPERLGRALARLYLRASVSRRRILLENLAAAFPEKGAEEIERIARASAEWLGAAFVEFLEVSSLSEEEVRSRVRIAGEENLRGARERGKGVFLLSAHFGGWELGAIRAGLLGEPIAPVVRPLDNPLLERELARRRTRFGNRLIAKRDGGERRPARDARRARPWRSSSTRTCSRARPSSSRSSAASRRRRRPSPSSS